MRENIKAIKFGLIASATFLIVVWIWSYALLKARTSTNPNISDATPTSLYVNSSETLTAAKRNTMIDRFKVYQAKVTHDITLPASAGWTAISDLSLDVPVGASGKILVWFYCSTQRWAPVYRINIDNWTSYENLWYAGGSDVATTWVSNINWTEALLEWYTPWSTKNLKIERKNTTGTEWLTSTVSSSPENFSCRMIAKTW